MSKIKMFHVKQCMRVIGNLLFTRIFCVLCPQPIRFALFFTSYNLYTREKIPYNMKSGGETIAGYRHIIPTSGEDRNSHRSA